MRKYVLLFILASIIYYIYFKSSITENNFIYPTKYTAISSYYGYRELYGYHNGIDFLAPEGSEIYAENN